jgi:hypothetical protein
MDFQLVKCTKSNLCIITGIEHSRSLAKSPTEKSTMTFMNHVIVMELQNVMVKLCDYMTHV